MPKPEDEECGRCEYLHQGACHLGPPELAIDPNARTEAEQSGSRWPPVSPHDWCGQFTAASPPALASLEPTSAEVGSADLTLRVNGSGFTRDSVIVFNGGDEHTEFIDSERLSTVVKPSLASGPVTVPIAVRNVTLVSNELPFAFTEPGAPEA